MKQVVIIPKERICVLDSKDLIFKKQMEEKLGVKLSFFENSVEIDGEGIEAMQAINIVKAIGRGFSPQRAERLFKDDEEFEIIELSHLSERRMSIVKSRIIGTNGKTREAIEAFTGAVISVYGKTVSIIGSWEQKKNAKKAVEMIIEGAMHTTVYKFLEKLK